MELRQLRYVVGISEAGSLLAASRALHVAQPALSHQVAALERELGVQLFARSHRGMALTEAGRNFVDHARVVLLDLERMQSSVRALGHGARGPVVLGLPTTVALVATLPILGAVRTRHPDVQLKMIESHSGFLAEWLQAGRLDVSFLFAGTNRPDISERLLLEERLVFVTRHDQAIASARVGLRAVCRHPLVLPAKDHGLRRIVDDACARSGLVPTLVAEIDSLPNIKKAVEAGIAATILSPGAVAEEVKAGRLAVATINHPLMLRQVVCAHSLTRPISPATEAVVAVADEVIRGLVRSKAWPARWIGA